jgi:cellulose synthase/poly-beta-1,6-N-acetylglucosamine synthase-like glycosyltransferase
MLLHVLSITLLLTYCALIIYYRWGWVKLGEYHPSRKTTTSVTVIIPARNEEANIGVCLESICNNNFPSLQYEIIVVDDHSEDHTAEIANTYASKGVKVLRLSDEIKGEVVNAYKKKAIESAISIATGSLIITTDADCIVPETWLNTIVSFYESTGAVFIAAPVVFHHERTLLSVFQSLDFMTMQGITAAGVATKLHYMCNGANLAYSKAAFHEVGGFKGIDNIASGDDMLLMHKIQEQHPNGIYFLKSREAIVETAPMKSLTAFFNQRIRWASKNDKYSDKKLISILAVVYLFNALLVLLTILSFLSLSQLPWLLFILPVKTSVELLFLYPVARFFSRTQLLKWFLPLQPLHIFYIVIAGWLGKFGSYKWKGRRVK